MHGTEQQAQSVQAIGHDQGHRVARLQTLAHEQRSDLAAVMRKRGEAYAYWGRRNALACITLGAYVRRAHAGWGMCAALAPRMRLEKSRAGYHALALRVCVTGIERQRVQRLGPRRGLHLQQRTHRARQQILAHARPNLAK